MEGVITGYAGVLDPVRLGLATRVSVRVWLIGQNGETVQRTDDSNLALRA